MCDRANIQHLLVRYADGDISGAGPALGPGLEYGGHTPRIGAVHEAPTGGRGERGARALSGSYFHDRAGTGGVGQIMVF